MIPKNDFAVMPSWAIKVLASAFLAGLIAWASFQTTTNYAQASDIAVIQTVQHNNKEQLDRIEGKLDKIILATINDKETQ
jgi:hypothetical protein